MLYVVDTISAVPLRGTIERREGNEIRNPRSDDLRVRDRSIVPDIAVFKWSRIPFDDKGEIPNDFLLCPDWVIEILSSEQRANRVTGNILVFLLK